MITNDADVIYPRSTQTYKDDMDFKLGTPEKIYNTCLIFHTVCDYKRR